MKSVVYKCTNKVFDNEIVKISTTSHFQWEINVVGRACIPPSSYRPPLTATVTTPIPILTICVREYYSNIGDRSRKKKQTVRMPQFFGESLLLSMSVSKQRSINTDSWGGMNGKK